VVTAAAVIMISVFAAFVPNGDASVKPIALGLAVGVFVDAFLVRMTLVPAVLALLGDRAWWLPSWLDRRLPSLDVEGAGLEHHLAHEAWTREHGHAVVRAHGVRLLDERGTPVLDGVECVVRPGSLLLVRTDDRVARRALMAAFAGRLPITDGRLVVLDRVLPEEAAAVRRRVHLFETFPRIERLSRLGRRHTTEPELVVVDDVDVFASEDELARRWELLATLTARGVTVVAGASDEPVGPSGLSWTTLTLPAEGVSRPATEGASL
jgi:RND superfamily putative drug exporter